jgi:hypothetical protein
MLGREPKKIKVTAGSELAALLDEAARTPLLLEKDGVAYRLARAEVDDIWAGYDAAKVIEALEQTAGSWADIDTDALIANLYRAREEGSRPASRL